MRIDTASRSAHAAAHKNPQAASKSERAFQSMVRDLDRNRTDGRSSKTPDPVDLHQAAVKSHGSARQSGVNAGGHQPAGRTSAHTRATGVTTPGLKQLQGPSGPNHFSIDAEGPGPDLAVGGTHDQQEAQRDATLNLSLLASASYATGHASLNKALTAILTGGHPAVVRGQRLPRLPGDGNVQEMLKHLPRNPPIGNDGQQVTHAVYRSDIPHATPKQAYQHFVDQPGQVFAAGGMEIRSKSHRLTNGGRYMLEIGSPAPTWLPVQINLNPQKNEITIHTLKGHVLRGEQTFRFVTDNNGGTQLKQNAHFQASSELPGRLQDLSSISNGQHQAWEHAHREIYEQFNGNPGYQGMGTQAFNDHQLGVWQQDAVDAAKDPGAAIDSAVDGLGVADNSVVDQDGEFIGRGMDAAGIPGAELIREGSDKLGDLAEWSSDKIGDVAKSAIDQRLHR